MDAMQGSVFSGMIVLWSGAIVDIPQGWVLCDGTKSTPNLEDCFIVGAGNTYAVDASGGSVVHSHGFVGDGHNHTLPGGGDISAGSDYAHGSDLTNAEGDTDNANSLPPYYALCYIMRR